MDVCCCRCQYTNVTFSPLFYCSKSRTIEATTNIEAKNPTNNFTVNNCNEQTKKCTQTIFVSHAYHTDTRLHNLAQTAFFFSLQKYSSFMEMLGCPINAAHSHNVACSQSVICACRQNKDRRVGRLNGGEREKWSIEHGARGRARN